MWKLGNQSLKFPEVQDFIIPSICNGSVSVACFLTKKRKHILVVGVEI